MEQTAEPRTEQTLHPSEGPDSLRRRKGAVVSLIVFGLLLIVTLTIDALRDASTMCGFALTIAGIMLSAAVADLLDPAARRLLASVRYSGIAMALRGLVL
ncbi:hypothetical protein M3C58_10095 [Brachybacterium muris]|uniref:hypothetical protein n=1 Tax=Brachybacterium muris TaxID=219301 RepID=UPI0021A32B1E|nr:hypothetical protein [Brachybacterium muris]MCT1998538.1 hypothetical protein [Brachybacterium muris]